METSAWKIIAIIFIVLFTLETSFFIWAAWSVIDEDNKTNECYYNICNGYPDARYEDGVCFCYDYDMLGNSMVVKTEVVK